MGVVAAGGIALIVYDDDFQGDRRFVQQFEPAEDVDMVYPLTAFNEVSSIGSQDVMISQGDVFAVRAEGPANRIEDLEAVVEDGRLVIRPRRGGPNIRLTGHDDVTFHVTMPTIDRVALAGSGDVEVDRVTGPGFTGLVEGGGELVIRDLGTDWVELSVDGSGDLAVSGTTREARLSIRGSGEVDAEGLDTTTASITIDGSGEASLEVAERAEVTVNGSGDVDVTGPGLCAVTINGSGDVTCEGSGDGGV